MWTLFGGRHRGYCDRVSRRSFLKIGSMGLGGLTLADLFELEARAGVGSSHKALINVHHGGGPSHQDMWDMKPEAPSAYRGEFSPIRTNVAGMEVCELMPKLATMADKYALIRSMVGSITDHSPNTTHTGYPDSSLEAVGGRPSIGSVVSKLQGSTGSAPPYVSWLGDVDAGYLGPMYKSYRPNGRAKRTLRPGRLGEDRLRARNELRSKIDGMRRHIDANGEAEALDKFQERAVDTVLSGDLAEALDLEKEDPRIRQKYTAGLRGGYQRNSERFLMARRLVEAGVRCVSIGWGGWDTHGNNFDRLRGHLPALDQAVSALLGDLSERGMLDDVTVAVWGEFGRTPKVNNRSGRDHWPRVASAFLAGGGMQTGQAIGATDRYAGEAVERPVHLHEVHATLYHNLGIDVENTKIVDPAGRPQYLVDVRKPMPELV